MDFDLLIVFGSILMIVFLSLTIGSSIHKRDLRFKERKLELEAAREGNASPDAAKKIEQLEQRVRVLERLATDRGQDIAFQIESLRSSPQADLAPAGERQQA